MLENKVYFVKMEELGQDSGPLEIKAHACPVVHMSSSPSEKHFEF